MILGNGLVGARVWADVPSVVVASVPLVKSRPDDSEREFPEVFTACAVTRAMRRANDVKKVDDDPETVRLSLSDFPLAVSHGDLVREQQVDPSLKPLFERALPAADARDSAQAYFIHDEVLVRKWVPHGRDFVGDPIFQIVVPSKFKFGFASVT